MQNSFNCVKNCRDCQTTSQSSQVLTENSLQLTIIHLPFSVQLMNMCEKSIPELLIVQSLLRNSLVLQTSQSCFQRDMQLANRPFLRRQNHRSLEDKLYQSIFCPHRAPL